MRLLLAIGAASLGAVVQGAVGFGFALLAAPLLVLIDSRLIPGPATIAGLGLVILSLRRNAGPCDWPGIRRAAMGLIPGTVAAGWVLKVVPGHAVAVLVGSLVLAGVLVSLAGLRVRRSGILLLAVGAASGFMGTAAAVGGPPMALAYQEEAGPVLRATLTRFFLIAGLLALPALLVAGRLGPQEALAGLGLLPGVAAGLALSGRLIPVLDRGHTRTAVLAVSALSSVAVLLRELA